MKRKRVLLVDDEKQILKLLRALVEGMGYEPILANDGVEALETLKTETVDVIVTDLMMTIIDGWTLAERVKEAHPTVRIVGISGKVIPQMDKSPLDAFVGKPFSIHALKKAIVGEEDL